MTLPSDDELATLSIFPHYEGDRYEFKGSFVNFDRKIVPTFCALLNQPLGGYLIIGVEDRDRIIHGVKATSKQIDHFLLGVDGILHMKLIITEQGEAVIPDNIRARIIERKIGDPIIIVSCMPTPGKRYMTRDGTTWIRLSASNYAISNERFYRENEYQSGIRQAQYHLHEQYSALVKGMEAEVQKLKGQMKEAEAKNQETLENLHGMILRHKKFVEMEGTSAGALPPSSLCDKFTGFGRMLLSVISVIM